MNKNIVILVLIIGLSIVSIILGIKKKKKILGKVVQAKRTIEWARIYFDRRYWCKCRRITKTVKAITKFIVFICLVISLLYYSNVISIGIDPFNIVLNKNLDIEDSIVQQLVIAQISTTFLITAVLSLVSNLENKYILGEKALGKLFIGNKITFSKVFFILTMIMFINILMIINKPIDIIIIINIFISFSILSWMTYRIMRLFLQANNIKKDLFVKYYYENKKMLDRSVPTKKYDSVMLDNLHDRCIYLIENNEIEYKEIQPIYLDIIDKALFNNKQLLQEYFIEPNIHDDILTKYLHMVKTLIDNNKVNIAIYYYISLLLRLNYYNAYIPNYNLFDTYYIINRFIYRCNDVTELEELVRNQLMIEELVLEQVYLCNKSDFSFMRLAKLRMIIKNKISSDLFASIYESIFNNKNIEKNDKNKLYRQLYDSFRMVSFNLVHKFHDITTFKPKKSIPPNRDVDIEIVAMPIARLLLSTINNNDKENLNLFIKMNIDNKQMILAKNLTLLYITLSDMYNKTEYSFYKGIYTDKAIEIINKNKNFFSGFDDYEILNSVYANIKEISKESSEDNNFYSDDYIFSFKESYIDTYFYALFKVLKIKITNKDLNVDKNYEDKLIKIISKMINAN